ncbi:hypothetical protein HS088_TW03G00821 [Tripterygium wilfordii]|uniref:DUF4378 domain-containing protein n=1 Tax=Tripterygium wilfordii TaxID=458696 RepID=A0A7J7DWF4_TRIWF|nr:uncharacterized protein LOC119987180 [Tripterygium wilfordii]KAF5750484.1 hypothetical protein HS088_TW03G00821 [Tripterygium wilfordii]
MAQKHLHELLKEDQEPFLLKNYIADRRSQLKGSSLPKTQLQVRKRKPTAISQQQQRRTISNLPHNLCKKSCLFSYVDSPHDPRRSPLFEFQSPVPKSPCRSSPNAIFLNVPARTATLLLEAALKIQKQSSKTKTQNKNHGHFGLFGSFLKRLTSRNRTRKREIGADGVKVSVRDILRLDSSVGRKRPPNERISERKQGIAEKSSPEANDCEIGSSCNHNGRPSSAVWSESNEEQSMDFDLETSSSSQSEELLGSEIEFVNQMIDDTDFTSCEKRFCESPFRFVLQRSTSSGIRTPTFSSPEKSPIRSKGEDKENYDGKCIKNFQVQQQQEEEEGEDKEQCSPVSVLDPPFEDYDDGHEDDAFDVECSYAIVQRAKEQLLHKLHRFEKLAELDPVELEKRMLEELFEDDDNICVAEVDVEEEYDDNRSFLWEKVKSFDSLIAQQLAKSGFDHAREIPKDMKNLVSDLIDEESRERNDYYIDREVVAKRVCKRLESWKEVESNTIDMMVEQDFRKEFEEWKRSQEQVEETALDIEVAIFGLLVEELTEELSSGII